MSETTESEIAQRVATELQRALPDMRIETQHYTIPGEVWTLSVRRPADTFPTLSLAIEYFDHIYVEGRKRSLENDAESPGERVQWLVNESLRLLKE